MSELSTAGAGPGGEGQEVRSEVDGSQAAHGLDTVKAFGSHPECDGKAVGSFQQKGDMS